jgi:hypothetical protein
MGWMVAVRFPTKAGIFFHSTASRQALGPTQPPIQLVPAAISAGVDWPGNEADHLPLSAAEVNNALICTCTPPTRPRGVSLK